MPDLGPHASFILAAYAVTALALGALVFFILADDSRQRRRLEELERRGITRRSAKPQASKSASRAGSLGSRAAKKPKA